MVRKNYRDVYRKGRIIQSWKALNLYNLANYEPPRFILKTFYQQKWLAKSHSRTYHGRQVREKQWQLMYNRRIPAVVEMNIGSLAKDDGSKQASGRGSGLDTAMPVTSTSTGRKFRPKDTPYAGMTYWPLERRLDTAIHRAMFASSVRTARQFVIHGHVKVNGKKMKYPGYLLNPGDMFSVDPELVMMSTGMPNTKAKQSYVASHPPSDAPAEWKRGRRTKDKKGESATGRQGEKVAEEASNKVEAESQATAEATLASHDSSSSPSANKLKAQLKEIEAKINDYLRPSIGRGYVFRTRRTTRLFKLRNLRREVREAIKAAESSPESEAKATTLQNRLKRTQPSPSPILSHIQSHTSPSSTSPSTHMDLLRNWPNPPLQDKPYLTPWLPRNWMSAFAFIPRYLEVNQNVCSAVYLRHPVARAGLAEVPSPFGKEIGLLAGQWYLRRR